MVAEFLKCEFINKVPCKVDRLWFWNHAVGIFVIYHRPEHVVVGTQMQACLVIAGISSRRTRMSIQDCCCRLLSTACSGNGLDLVAKCYNKVYLTSRGWRPSCSRIDSGSFELSAVSATKSATYSALDRKPRIRRMPHHRDRRGNHGRSHIVYARF